MSVAFQLIPFVAYVAVAHPATYKLTRKVLGDWIANSEGLATLPGVALHAVVFVLLATLLMRFLAPAISKASMTSPPTGAPKTESEAAMARLTGRYM